MLYLLKNDRRIITFLNIQCIFQIANLITSEIISSSNYHDDLKTREFQFDGDFNNVISILIPDMQGYGRQEYGVISSSKQYILVGFNLDNVHVNPTNLKIEIIRLKKL